MIPVGMEMYPGNESEQPVFRNIISGLKKRNNIKGRTIRVADKETEQRKEHYRFHQLQRWIYLFKVSQEAARG